MPIDYSKRDGIALVGLNRPDAKNALDASMLKQLDAAWADAAGDPAVRAVILFSSLPDIFCAGMDLKTVIPVMTGVKPARTDDEKWLVENPAAVFTSMLRRREWDKPIIAAIHGICLTGGFEMIMGADLRIASDDAVFQMREATFGIMPISGSTVYLPRQIPLAAAKEILILGDEIPSRRLYEWGFLNQVTSKRDLMDAAMRMARRICSNGPLAVQGILHSIRAGAGLDTEAAMAKEIEIGLPIFSSEDAREGVRAFKEKRKPDFKGE
jgi:enoyl-CoA hydratase